MSAFAVALGHKADMPFCTAHVCFRPKAVISTPSVDPFRSVPVKGYDPPPKYPGGDDGSARASNPIENA